MAEPIDYYLECGAKEEPIYRERFDNQYICIKSKGLKKVECGHCHNLKVNLEKAVKAASGKIIDANEYYKCNHPRK